MDTSSKQSGTPVMRFIWVFALAGILLFAVVPLFHSVAPAPMVDNARILTDDIYRAVDRTKRIPVEVALPHVARAGLSAFLHVMPLEEDVRERVQARLDRQDFVDEFVPFLLAVKDMYVAPQEMDVKKFSQYIAKHYAPDDELPGMVHSMFSWPAPESAAEQSTAGHGQKDEQGFGLTLELAAQLVAMYDALYLAGNDGAVGIQERLACSNGDMSARFESTAREVKPSVQVLLEKVRAGMDEEAEFGHSIDAILADDDRLETITLSLVHFIDLMVCKHYRMFASRVSRGAQLATWMNGQLKKDDGGDLWAYIDHAQNRRRYGVVIAVDGLQGHLIEALATNASTGRFIQSIAAEQKEGSKRISNADADKLSQQADFLAHFATRGFQHEAYLPFFRNLYADAGEQDHLRPTGIAKGGISTTPTISVRNLPIIKTGAPVAGDGSTGVPNFHFVDRQYERDGIQQGRAYYFFGNDALQLTSLTQASGMKTLYERLPALSSYNCAAQYDESANAGIDPFLNLALGEAVRDFGEVLCFKELQTRLANEQDLQGVRSELLDLRNRLGVRVPWYNWYQWWSKRTASQRAVQLVQRIAELESRGMPELMIYYNPWPDHFAHFTGPFADEVVAPTGELARLDYWLGQLMGLYEQAGIVDRAVFGMSGDHGLSPVFSLVSPHERVLKPMLDRGVPLNIIKISSDEGEGPKLTHVLRPPSMRGYDVVIASTAGGNLMMDLFTNQTDQWAMQPVEAELRQWQPIAWQESSSTQYIDLIDELIRGLGDTLEYLVVRTDEGNSFERTSIALYGPDGRAELLRRGQRIFYRPVGRELLGLAAPTRYSQLTPEQAADHQRLLQRCLRGAELEDQDSWCDEAQWRRLASYTSKPDAVVQLAHLYDSDRAGTINLFPAQGVAYNSIVPGRHAGESFHEKDAFVGVWGAPVTATNATRPRSALGGAVPMAIFEHLSGQHVTQDKDGWGYPSLWTMLNDKEIATHDSE